MKGSKLSLFPFVAVIVSLPLISIFGSKILSLVERSWFEGDLAFELAGGWRQPGGTLLLALLGPIAIKLCLPRLSWRRFFDGYLIFHAFKLGLYRIRCHLQGCCVGGQCDGGYCLEYGQHTHVYWSHLRDGIILPGATHSAPVFPLHFAYMVLGIGLAIFLFWYSRRSRFEGEVALLFFVIHEYGKGALEVFREPSVPLLQMVSWITATLALLVLIALPKHGVRQKSQRPLSGK